MRNHSSARTYDYKDVNLHVHFLHLHTYLYLLTNVVTFLLCCYLFRQPCHVKRAAQRMVTCIRYESSSKIRHNFCEMHTTWTYIIYALISRNHENIFHIKIHCVCIHRSTYVGISTNQNNYVQWTVTKKHCTNIWWNRDCGEI